MKINSRFCFGQAPVISWFLRLHFCGLCRNIEFTIYGRPTLYRLIPSVVIDLFISPDSLMGDALSRGTG